MEAVERTDVAVTSRGAVGAHGRELLRSFLRDRSATSDEQWRRWCADLVRGARLRDDDLLDWWTGINEFDQVLAQHVAEPVTVPDTTVVVAGSGKEQFRTFNISTAAAILAASAGTPVVKGISRSVSAVSGAADILEVLGVTPVTHPGAVQHALQRYNIAFVGYPVFCPRYAGRYDGIFDSINPASFFMPVAALCVRASGFVLGLAHTGVMLSAKVLRTIRPDIATGVVVSTELSRGESVDELSDVGTVRLARVSAGTVYASTHTYPRPTKRWRRSVAHQRTHRGNAALVADALAAHGDSPCTRIVELNASLIVSTTAAGVRPGEAIDRVRHARRSGRALRLLTAMSGSR